MVKRGNNIGITNDLIFEFDFCYLLTSCLNFDKLNGISCYKGFQP